MKQYKFKKNLLIKGEETRQAPKSTDRYGDHWEITLALGNDATANLIFSEDGRDWLIENGYIDAVGENSEPLSVTVSSLVDLIEQYKVEETGTYDYDGIAEGLINLVDNLNY